VEGGGGREEGEVRSGRKGKEGEGSQRKEKEKEE
jgi:hypothetical protein